jgi:hypothetical protein
MSPMSSDISVCRIIVSSKILAEIQTKTKTKIIKYTDSAWFTVHCQHFII